MEKWGPRLAAAMGAVTTALVAAGAVHQVSLGAWKLGFCGLLAALATAALIVAMLRRVPASTTLAIGAFYFHAFTSVVSAWLITPFLWIAAATALVAAVLPSRRALLQTIGLGGGLVVAGAGVVFTHVAVYRIPSSAMGPTLIGDKDRIAALQHYYRQRPVERYDIVLFQFPLNRSRTFIKRVVGMPGEEFHLDRGDVWTRPAGSSEPFRIARKPMTLQRALWIREETKLDDWESESRAAHRVEDGVLRTVARDGSRDAAFARAAIEGDAMVAFELELFDKQGVFFVEIPNQHGRFRLELSPERAGSLTWTTPRQSKTGALKRIEPDRRYRVELAVYDGAVCATIDGQSSEFPFAGEAQSPEPIRFGATGTLFAISRLEVGRDIHYEGRAPGMLEGREHAFTIPQDHYVMLGDNVASSHDSRGWREHVFKLKDGAVVRCEGQDVRSDGVQSDESGVERTFSEADVVSHEERPFPFVHRRHVHGKPFWIWFPSERWRWIR